MPFITDFIIVSVPRHPGKPGIWTVGKLVLVEVEPLLTYRCNILTLGTSGAGYKSQTYPQFVTSLSSSRAGL